MSSEHKRKAMKRYNERTKRHNVSRNVSAAMLYAVMHPVRREVLRVINAAIGPISPKEVSNEILWDLPSVSFHVRVLEERKIVDLTHTQQVKGSTEHFYVSTVAENELLAAILSGTKMDDRIIFED